MTSTIKASDVRIGDRLRIRTGLELTVTRIDLRMRSWPDYLSFVEDSHEQWLKLPVERDGEVELVSRGPQ